MRCELCESEPVLRRIDFEKENGKSFFLDLGTKCIIKLLGD